MWPEVGWYSTWDYQTGIDPFIDKVYDQDVGDGVFKNAKSSEFTDWSSYVKAFGEHNCYWYGFIYSFIATENWKAKKSSWGGSCFGIAAANAIAFEDSVEFRANFPNFPTFVTPSTVKPDNLVRMAITQLFSHQLGNPNETIRSVAYNTSPTQTIRDLKKMLKEDNVKIRNLLFWSNDTSNPGGHAINVYKLEQNPDTLELFTVYVWDNSYPNSLKAKIIVDTSANNGKGSWEPKYAWSTWGGYYHFGLDLPATTYLNNSSLTKTNMKQTPFLLDENELKVYNTPSANIEIKDNLGNVTGFGGSGVMSNIPNSVPLIFLNGSTGPPYGYLLPKNNYSIKMNNFKNDTVNTFVFTGNKIFEYERSAATNNQTDNLFFDGGMSVSNPNAEMKTVKLLNVISDIATGSEKLFSIKSLNLSQNDSVKIVNPDEDNLDIISYGSEKTYKIEIEYVSEDKISSFSNDNVVLTANSTQKIVPNWEKTGDLEISVYVDEGNDGTIDDTLEVKNQVTGVEEEHGSTIPTEFRLEQNYPNPFNPNTSIRYSISNENNVILKVYDILGKEVATLVNERKSSGYYVVNFDASNLTSGIYFYTIRAGSFSETKKMLLMK
ncbi:MAG: T9SS type A sorting domain-containing protein [Ignavibacteriales bacterium]|nr:T9SS type A sorting domain-containing protein [Ignavibacteriales bacterium]